MSINENSNTNKAWISWNPMRWILILQRLSATRQEVNYMTKVPLSSRIKVKFYFFSILMLFNYISYRNFHCYFKENFLFPWCKVIIYMSLYLEIDLSSFLNLAIFYFFVKFKSVVGQVEAHEIKNEHLQMFMYISDRWGMRKLERNLCKL